MHVRREMLDKHLGELMSMKADRKAVKKELYIYTVEPRNNGPAFKGDPLHPQQFLIKLRIRISKRRLNRFLTKSVLSQSFFGPFLVSGFNAVSFSMRIRKSRFVVILDPPLKLPWGPYNGCANVPF